MTREEIVQYCLGLPDTYLDYPFDSEWQAIRSKKNQKTFAFIFKHQNGLWMNVKCDPLKGQFLREHYEEIKLAYHMNKKHWNSIILDGSVPDEDIKRMIGESYDLIRAGIRRQK